MQPKNWAATSKIISSPRLSSYQAFFHPANDRELFGIYYWNLEISVGFYILFSIIEIAVRNTIHSSLSNYLVPGNFSTDWHNKLNLHPKTLVKIKKVTHYKNRVGKFVPRQPQPSPDDIVSRMTFGFWKSILQTTDLIDGTRIDWSIIFPNMLSNHPHNASPNFWKKEKNRDKIIARIKIISDLRNRVCHYEPLWKLNDIYEERLERPNYSRKVEFPAPTNHTEAIKRIRVLHDRAVELLFFISGDRANDYTHSKFNKNFLYICSDDGLDAYKKMNIHQTKNITCSPCYFIDTYFTSKQSITILNNGEEKGIFFPYP